MSALNSPVAGWVSVTPSDSADLPQGVCRGIFIDGTAGSVAFIDALGNTVTINSFPAGQEIGARIRRILASGTTATTILALY
jgi:hypothetical protein